MAKCKFKEWLDKYTLSVVMLFVGVGFLIASFIVPPIGVIDSSVLTAVGEIFTFTAAVCGIEEYGLRTKLKYKNREDGTEAN